MLNVAPSESRRLERGAAERPVHVQLDPWPQQLRDGGNVDDVEERVRRRLDVDEAGVVADSGA